jgi:hypothetical protein
MHDLTIEATFFSGRGARGRKLLHGNAPATASASARIPRIARLMALAIRLDRLVGSGEVANQAELAQLGHVSRARISHIMNLLLLAPDIQETLLFLTEEDVGPEGLHLRQLQSIAVVPSWRRQRRLWATVGIRSSRL